MQTVKVKCPNCGTTLVIENIPGISNRMLTCPVCGFRAKVSVFQQETDSYTITQTLYVDEEPTRVLLNDMDHTIGVLRVYGKEYALHLGNNTIGRKAKSGHAEVQISEDEYMSRQHAMINIEETSEGFVHKLTPTNPKNPIRVNDAQVLNGETISLKWGDKLQFGRTEIVFDKPLIDDEATKLM